MLKSTVFHTIKFTVTGVFFSSFFISIQLVHYIKPLSHKKPRKTTLVFNQMSGFELAVHNLQFMKHFGSLQMSFCIFLKNCESLKLDALWILRVIHLTSYIVSYFKPIKYPLLNNNVISQRFTVHINFKLHTSLLSSYYFVMI